MMKVLDNDVLSGFHLFLLEPTQALCLAACFGVVIIFILLFPILVVVKVAVPSPT